MADALDSKSSDRKIVWVQVPPPVLTRLTLSICWPIQGSVCLSTVVNGGVRSAVLETAGRSLRCRSVRRFCVAFVSESLLPYRRTF